MEIKPLAGFTLVPLPSGKFAFVTTEIVGPRAAAKIAKALTAKPTQPPSEEPSS